MNGPKLYQNASTYRILEPSPQNLISTVVCISKSLNFNTHSQLMLTHCARLPPLSKSIGYAQSDTKRTKRRTTGNLLVNLLLSQRGKEFLSLENQEQKKTFKTCPCRFGSRFRSLVCQQGKKRPKFLLSLCGSFYKLKFRPCSAAVDFVLENVFSNSTKTKRIQNNWHDHP